MSLTLYRENKLKQWINRKNGITKEVSEVSEDLSQLFVF